MSQRMKMLLSVYLASMAVMHIFILIKFSDFTRKGYSDFAAFYTAGIIVKEGQARELYNPAEQWRVQKQFAPHVAIRKGPLPYIHPPYEAWLFLPFTYLNYKNAYVVWIFFQSILLIASLCLLLPKNNRTIANVSSIGFLSIGLFPIAMALLQGQDSMLLLLVFSLSSFWLMRGKALWSGIALAMGLFKFQIIVFVFLVFVLRRKWKLLMGFISMSFFLLSGSIAMVGLRGIVAYLQYLWGLDHNAGLGVTTWWNMPNLRSIFTWGLGNSNLRGVIPGTICVVALAAAIYIANLWKNHETERFYTAAGFALTVVTSIICSYYVYGYEMSLLLIPLVGLGETIMTGPEFRDWPKGIFIFATILFLLAPLGWLLVLNTKQFFLYGCLIPFLYLISLIGAMQRTQNSFRSMD